MKLSFTLRFVAFALLFTGFSTLNAQDSTADASYNSEGRFGVRVGGIISKQKFEDGMLDEDPESKFGLDVALLYTLPIGDGFLNLQPELHWMQKGSTFSDLAGEDVTTTMNYLELPLLLRLNFGGSLKLFAFGGPSVGYLLGVDSDDDILKKEDFEDIEFGLHLGAGVGFGSFEIDVRYLAGLSDVADSDGNLGEIKNSAFGAGLTFKF
jgi:hypothetical protein